MAGLRHLTALIEWEDDCYVALCPEIDVASQGATVEEARSNLQEAVELFFETASPQEIEERCHPEVYVTHLDVCLGWAAQTLRQRGLPHLGGARLP
jgi:predicted RNase H-like HicB family nuclease